MRAKRMPLQLRLNDRRSAQLVGSPALLLVIAFIGIPLLFIFRSSLYGVTFANALSGEASFAGIDNYSELFGDVVFSHSILVTLIFSVVTVFGAYLIGLLAAIIIDRLGNNTLKSILFLALLVPWAMPQVPTGLVFRWMFDRNYGVVNHLLLRSGLVDAPLEFTLDKWTALAGVIIASIWTLYPIALIMLYANLQSIPDELYEAAKVDGATPLDEIKYISIPALRVISLTLMLVLTLFSFRSVTTIFVMTGGGPSRGTEVLALFTYLEAFRFQNLGIASAAAVLSFILVLVLSLLYLMLLRKARA